MTITFTIAASLTGITVPPARIDARQLAAFRAFAHENGALTGSQPHNDPTFPSYDFEARVCAWSLSTLSSLFGYGRSGDRRPPRRPSSAAAGCCSLATARRESSRSPSRPRSMPSPISHSLLRMPTTCCTRCASISNLVRSVPMSCAPKLKDPHTIERLWRAGLHRYLPRLTRSPRSRSKTTRRTWSGSEPPSDQRALGSVDQRAGAPFSLPSGSEAAQSNGQPTLASPRLRHRRARGGGFLSQKSKGVARGATASRIGGAPNFAAGLHCASLRSDPRQNRHPHRPLRGGSPAAHRP